MKGFIVLTMTLVLTGCLSSVTRTPENGVGPGQIYHSSQSYLTLLKQERLNLQSKENCCVGFNELKYKELRGISGKVKLTFSNTTQTFEFVTGKSYVQGIELPAESTPYKLRFISPHITTSMFVTSGGVFHPIILALDSNFSVLKQFPTNIFNFYADESFGFQTDSGLNAYLNIEGSLLEKAKYLVIYTSDQLMKQNTHYLFSGSRKYIAPDNQEEINHLLNTTSLWLVVAPNVPVGQVLVIAEPL